MKFLEALRSGSAPKTADQLREALAEAEKAAQEASERVDSLTRQRASALLDADDRAVDKVERELAMAGRDRDRADLACGELSDRLAEAAKVQRAEEIAALRQRGEAIVERGGYIITERYPPHATAIRGLAEELVGLHDELNGINKQLAMLGQSGLPEIYEKACPELGEIRVGAHLVPFWDRLALPSTADPVKMLWPHKDIHGFELAENARPAR